MSKEEECFTVVFEGNLRDRFQGNPFNIDSPFGRPVAIAAGDMLTLADELERQLEEATIGLL